VPSPAQVNGRHLGGVPAAFRFSQAVPVGGAPMISPAAVAARRPPGCRRYPQGETRPGRYPLKGGSLATVCSRRVQAARSRGGGCRPGSIGSPTDRAGLARPHRSIPSGSHDSGSGIRDRGSASRPAVIDQATSRSERMTRRTMTSTQTKRSSRQRCVSSYRLPPPATKGTAPDPMASAESVCVTQAAVRRCVATHPDPAL